MSWRRQGSRGHELMSLVNYASVDEVMLATSIDSQATFFEAFIIVSAFRLLLGSLGMSSTLLAGCAPAVIHGGRGHLIN